MKNLAIAVLLLQFAVELSAQVPVKVIPDRPACPNCRIERVLIATLTDDSVPSLGLFTMVTATSDGRFLITRVGERTPFVADRKGRVVQQIGRAGSGPGEYRFPQYCVETGSEFFIFDQHNRRVSRLSKSFTFESSAPLPSIQIAPFPIFFRDGRYVINAAVASRDGVGHPLHVVSTEGNVIRSFGGDATTAVQTPDIIGMRRLISLAADSTVWVAHDHRYRIERWDTTGKLIAAFERQASWFPPGRPGTGETQIRSIAEDPDGNLWVHITRFGPSRASIIEVLDPDKLQLIASLRVDNWRGDPVNGGFLMLQYRESAIGEPRVDIWGFRLHRPGQPLRGTL